VGESGGLWEICSFFEQAFSLSLCLFGLVVVACVG